MAAHGSLQTFTNRILLNLEDDLAPNHQLADEWEWMHAYRLWEANRKVFLWPENWIEPELRDDKSPLFEDLETALLQGEITDKGAEAAYRAYLDGLADVANLEIVAIHTEKRGAAATAYSRPQVVVHAIGPTKKPHRYFHRKRTSEGWTPWRKIDADVQVITSPGHARRSTVSLLGDPGGEGRVTHAPRPVAASHSSESGRRQRRGQGLAAGRRSG